MKILIVDEDKLLNEMYRDAFELKGNQVVSASGAQDAVNKLDKNLVDLIVMDMILPGRSAVEVLHELNSYTDWQLIPVILMSDIKKKAFKISQSDMKRYSVQRFLYKQDITPLELVDIAEELVGAKV